MEKHEDIWKREVRNKKKRNSPKLTDAQIVLGACRRAGNPRLGHLESIRGEFVQRRRAGIEGGVPLRYLGASGHPATASGLCGRTGGDLACEAQEDGKLNERAAGIHHVVNSTGRNTADQEEKLTASE